MRGELFVQNIDFLCRRSEATGGKLNFFDRLVVEQRYRSCAFRIANEIADRTEWHEADIPFTIIDVRFRGQSGHQSHVPQCLLLTQSGHHDPVMAAHIWCNLRTKSDAGATKNGHEAQN
jgi:hypothetical protein